MIVVEPDSSSIGGSVGCCWLVVCLVTHECCAAHRDLGHILRLVISLHRLIQIPDLLILHVLYMKL